MSELFRPKDQKEKDLTKPFEKPKPEDEEVLIFASENYVFALPDFNGKPQIISSFDLRAVNAVCFNDNVLYHASGNTVYNTWSGEAVAVRDNDIVGLWSHGVKLYDWGNSDYVMETLDHKEFIQSTGGITAFCASLEGMDDIFYFADGTGYIHNMTYAQGVAYRHDGNVVLHVEDTVLFDGYKNSITGTLSTEHICNREDIVKCFCSCNGRVYDSGLYGKIYDTLDSRVVFDRKSEINAMCSVSREFWEEVLSQ